MAPTTPYSTAAQAAILMQSMFRGIVPGATTPITATVLSTLITWTDSIIDQRFAGIGYVIPFQGISGETWPASQTSFLNFLSAIGSAAMAGGYILTPAPDMRPGRAGGERNIYAALFESLLGKVEINGQGFRAAYWPGTKAEKWIDTPKGPRLDFLEGYYDPTRYQHMFDFTAMISDVKDEMADFELDWDYLYALTV
jgi:hypothetical protein